MKREQIRLDTWPSGSWAKDPYEHGIKNIWRNVSQGNSSLRDAYVFVLERKAERQLSVALFPKPRKAPMASDAPIVFLNDVADRKTRARNRSGDESSWPGAQRLASVAVGTGMSATGEITWSDELYYRNLRASTQNVPRQAAFDRRKSEGEIHIDAYKVGGDGCAGDFLFAGWGRLPSRYPLFFPFFVLRPGDAGSAGPF